MCEQGTNDPGRISLTGYSDFRVHRQNLYDKYHPQGKYPLEDDWGDAKVLDSIDAPYEVILSEPHPEKSKDGLYYIDYEVVPRSESVKTQIYHRNVCAKAICLDFYAYPIIYNLPA